VDVRDVALAHLKAMEMPELAGTRNIVSARFVWMKEVAQILKAEFEPQGFSISTRTTPYPLAWLVSLFHPAVRQIIHVWGVEWKFDNKRMTKIMGIDPPRDVKTSILQMAYSMLDKGLVKIPKRLRKQPKP